MTMQAEASKLHHKMSAPTDIVSVSGFIGDRFAVNHEHRLKNYVLSEQFIQQHELKNYDDWFWAGEQIGKWLDSAAYSGLIAKDQALIERVHEIIERLARSQEADGYLGITVPYHRTPVRGMQLYEWYYVLHGLLICADLLNSEIALGIAKRLGEFIIRTWGVEPEQFPLVGLYPGNGHDGGEGSLILEPIVLLGTRLDDQRFIAWGEQTVAQWDAWYAASPKSVHSCSFAAMKQYAAGEKQIDDLRDNLHAHTFHMNLLGIAALYNATGKEDYRQIVTGCVNRIASDWIFLTGGMSSGERYIPPRFYHATGEIEVCPQHTWILLLEQLYQWTGKSRYLEPIERDLFNQFLAAQLADGSNWSYMTPMNGHAQEPVHPNCCNASGQRIASRMPTYLTGLHQDCPAILIYSESKTVVRAPGLPPVTLEQTTDFPSSGEVSIVVTPESTATFALHLRIPSYSMGVVASVNGIAVETYLNDNFLILERTWEPGDLVELRLPLLVRCQGNTREVAIVRGPLVYALFQNAQSANEVYHWHRAFHVTDAELVIDPDHPEQALREQAPPIPGMLGPALNITGHYVARTPVFVSPETNQTLPQGQDKQFVLVPFANQGAIRGEYQVFTAYQKP